MGKNAWRPDERGIQEIRDALGAVAGLFCFLPAHELLIRPGVPVLRLGMLPMWIVSLGALSIGVPLIAAAILGISRTVMVDPHATDLRELGAGAFGLRFQRRHAFRDQGQPTVRRDDFTDGPPRCEVVVPNAARKRPILIETYADETAAGDAARRIAAVLTPASAFP